MTSPQEAKDVATYLVERLLNQIQQDFRTFGGGRGGNGFNPIADALKDHPLQFAAGVDVRAIVELVLSQCSLSTAPREEDKDALAVELTERLVDELRKVCPAATIKYDGMSEWQIEGHFELTTIARALIGDKDARITGLEAEVERLREALRRMLAVFYTSGAELPGAEQETCAFARAALKGGQQ